MAKQKRFMWSWYENRLGDDPMMTRQRLASLLRAWRNSPEHSVRCSHREAAFRDYMVLDRKYGIAATARVSA